jgi:hypothetical protein
MATAADVATIIAEALPSLKDNNIWVQIDSRERYSKIDSINQ